MVRSPALLAALSPLETQDFLPEPMLGQVRALAGSYHHVDPSSLDTAGLAALLAEHQPEVLLACWRTPTLPADLPASLRYVCYLAGSVKKLVTRQQVERGLLVTNWGNSISRTVAECALLHILSCLRRTAYWTVAMHRDEGWKDRHIDTCSLFGRRIGIHGFGAIAREFIKLVAPFGCPISVHAPDTDTPAARALGVTPVATLADLFAHNDIVVELAPLIPATTRSVREEHLRRLAPGSVFVNVGRGAVVDEEALLRVAREGNIFVGLDVYSTEPLPVDSGFRGLPNVMLTPHFGGPTKDRRCDAGAQALRNLQAYVAGQPLTAVVTPAIFDSSS